jgi:hypothetical protein
MMNLAMFDLDETHERSRWQKIARGKGIVSVGDSVLVQEKWISAMLSLQTVL